MLAVVMIKITVPKVNEKISAVSLLRVLCAIKFLPIKIFMLLDSQKRSIRTMSHCRMPYRFEARSVSPDRSPTISRKKMFRISLKLPEIRARGRM